MAKLEKIARETPGVAHTIGNPGRSFVLNAIGSNLGTAFVALEPFDRRRAPGLGAEAIAAELRRRFRTEIPEARINVFGAPAVDGLGSAGGFKLMVESTGDVNYDALQAQADNVAAKANKLPGVVGRSTPAGPHPQLYADIDRPGAVDGRNPDRRVGTSRPWRYCVNDFNRFGHTWRVNLQADSCFRADVETIKQPRSATRTATWSRSGPWPTSAPPSAR